MEDLVLEKELIKFKKFSIFKSVPKHGFWAIENWEKL